MTRRAGMALGAALVLGAGVLTGCDAVPLDTTADGSQVQVAVTARFSSLNGTAGGASTTDAAVQALTRSSFVTYDAAGEVRPNEAFGTVQVVGEEPFMVRYTVQEGVTWSDGVPVDAADLLLAWAAASTTLNDCAADRPAGESGTVPGEVCFRPAQDALLDRVLTTARVEADGRSITLTYAEPFADWLLALRTPAVPAHLAAEHALGIARAAEGKDAVVGAITVAQEGVEGDARAVASARTDLAAIAGFWNHGLDVSAAVGAPDLWLSSGPYVLEEIAENRFLSFTVNPQYTWAAPPTVERIVLRWIADPLAAVQSLQLGEVDVLAVPATPPVLAALREVDDVETEVAPGRTLLHLDLALHSGAFSAAAYGGDPAVARTVRTAFLHTVPRPRIVAATVAPVLPGAVAEDSWTVLPGGAGHAEVVQENGSAQYARPDPDRARSLLADAGVDLPVPVRLAGSAAHGTVLTEIAESATEAGFDVVVVDEPGAAAPPDAVLRTTAHTSDAVLPLRAQLAGAADAATDPTIRELLEELVTATDPGPRATLQLQLEQALWAEAVGIPITRLPVVTAVRVGVEGVHASPYPPSLLWNVTEWHLEQATPAMSGSTPPEPDVTPEPQPSTPAPG